MRAAALALGTVLAATPGAAGAVPPRKPPPPGTGARVLPVVHRPALAALAGATKPGLLLEHRPVTRAELSSGARLLVQPDPGLSTAALCLTLEVGARDEADDQAGAAAALGFALQRLPVSASGVAARAAVLSRGGEDALELGRDRTLLCSAGPASELPLLASVAAARLRAAAGSGWSTNDLPALAFAGTTTEIDRRLDGLVLAGVAALDRTVSDADVHAVRGSVLAAFGAAHVRAGRVGFVAVGPADAQLVAAALEKALGGLRLAPSEPAAYGAPPEQRSPRAVWAPDPLAQSPRFALAWAAPGSGKQSFASAEIAARVLADGAASRLGMAARRKSGIDAHGFELPLERGTAVLRITASAGKLADVSAPLELELRALSREGPEPGEVARAAARAQLDWIARVGGARGRAAALADAELALRDASATSDDPLVWHAERLLAVTDDDVQDVAGSVLDWQRRCVLEHQLPPPPPPPKPKPEKRPPPPVAASAPAKPPPKPRR